MTTSALVPLLREMAADPRIVDALVDAARAAAPEVARLPAAENRRHIADLLGVGLAAFERSTDPGAQDFAGATRQRLSDRPRGRRRRESCLECTRS